MGTLGSVLEDRMCKVADVVPRELTDWKRR